MTGTRPSRRGPGAIALTTAFALGPEYHMFSIDLCEA